MISLKLTPKEIFGLYKRERVGSGGSGLVIPYNYDTLVKLYHGRVFNASYPMNSRKVAFSIDSYEQRINLNMNDYLLENQTKKMEKLEDIGLLKGTVFYKKKQAILGVLLTYYYDYINLNAVFDTFTVEQKKIVLTRVKKYLQDLMSMGIYPEDLKEDNIMIRLNDLDVRIIDLDDDRTYYYENPDDAFNSAQICVEKYARLLRKI